MEWWQWGALGKGEYKTGGRHGYNLPLLLPQVLTNGGLVLLLSKDPHSNIWPLSVYRSQRTGRCDLGGLPNWGQDVDAIDWIKLQDGKTGTLSSPFQNKSTVIFHKDVTYWEKCKNIQKKTFLNQLYFPATQSGNRPLFYFGFSLTCSRYLCRQIWDRCTLKGRMGFRNTAGAMVLITYSSFYSRS